MVLEVAGAGIPALNPLLEAAGGIQAILQGFGWRFCVIGGIALLRWGHARFTVSPATLIWRC